MDRDFGLGETTEGTARDDAFARDLMPAQSVPAERPDHPSSRRVPDDVDSARAQEYALLGSLLLRAPDEALLTQLSRIQGSPSPLGLAHIALAQAAESTRPDLVQREYFNLFIGVGRGELVPYASFYLTGFLNDRPLVRLRDDLRRFGLERAKGHYEPEDHAGTLCELMSGLAGGGIDAPHDEDRQFFRRHVTPWMGRFLQDLETAKSARFYAAVGAVGRSFLEIEAEAFAMDR